MKNWANVARKQKNLPRKFTEFHGISRKQNQAEAENLPRINTELHGRKQKNNHGRKNTSFRAGCVSDGCFLAVKLRDREILAVCLHLP
jgi:hypothetical protein